MPHHDPHPVTLTACVHRFPDFTLGPVDLEVSAGRVHGLLGPNGNGKTTIINLAMGLLQPSAGRVAVFGDVPRADGAALYRQIGFSPDADDLVDELSAPEYWGLIADVLAGPELDRHAALDGAAALADRLSFTPGTQLARGFSHGMRRKTQLVASLMAHPRLIVLDEPTNGLDPISAYALGRTLRERAEAGAAVLVATHDLAWAESFTDVVSIVRGGMVAEAAPTAQVLRPDPQSTLLEGFMAAADALARLGRPRA